jgi:Helitron helicase-like domain at N-terminus
MRSNIRGIIVRYGMPGFWITINPSDLRNPLVVILAGVEYSGDIFAAANAAIRHAAATSNPVAVAEFFCKLDAVLCEAAAQMADDSFDCDVDELDVQDLDLEDEDGTSLAVRNDDVDIETLILPITPFGTGGIEKPFCRLIVFLPWPTGPYRRQTCSFQASFHLTSLTHLLPPELPVCNSSHRPIYKLGSLD